MIGTVNYMNLNEHPIVLRFVEDRTNNFTEVYHSHQGIELIYIHQGKGKVIIEQKIYTVEDGTLVIFSPFQLHRVQMSTSKPYIRSLFLVEPRGIESFLSPFPHLKGIFEQLKRGAYHILQGLNEREISELFSFHQKRLDEKGGLLEQQVIFMFSFLKLISPQLVTASTKNKSNQPPYSNIEKIMDWINNHYMKPFCLEQLAKSLHLSPVYVSSLFRKQTGNTITEYLTACRIIHACRLLSTSDLSIQEITEMVGLSNASYFCNIFKKHIGTTPHQFRKSFSGNHSLPFNERAYLSHSALRHQSPSSSLK